MAVLSSALLEQFISPHADLLQSFRCRSSLSNRLRRGRRGAMSFHSRSPPTMLDRSQNVLKGVSLLLWVGRVCIHTQRLSRTALTSPETIPSGCGKSDALYLVRAMPGYNRSATCRGFCALRADLRERMRGDAQFPYLFVWTWKSETFRVAKNHGDVGDQASVGTERDGLIQSRRIARLDC